MRYIVSIVFLFFIATAHAEYRAFLLKITRGPAEVGKEQDFRLVKSNLDPEQYATYYPLKSDEKIIYTDTWMCRGRTSQFQPICDSPHQNP